MSDWADLVTTALLGTGRRPLPPTLPPPWGMHPDPDLQPDPDTARDPDHGTAHGAAASDPAVRLLDLACRHRAVVRAAPAPARAPGLGGRAPAPPADRTAPPERASELLGELLVRPTPELVNAWLTCAGAAGHGVPAAYWTRLARLAAHSTAYDRVALGHAFGARGRWFLEQNPDWRRLASDGAPRPETAPGAGPAARPAPPSPETVRGRPTAIFEHPDPWPGDVVAAAYAVLGSATLGRRAREYAGRVGGRLPLSLYRTVAAAAEYYLVAPDATPAQRRMIKESFVIVEQAAFVRVQIERSFADDLAAAEFRRVEIPRV